MSSAAPVLASDALTAQLSDTSQLELLSRDVNINDVILNVGNRIGMNLQNVVNDIVVSRTIEGASSITVTVLDADRNILRNGNLKNRVDIKLGGLWWRVTGFDKTGDMLSIYFEEREISYLRTYNKIPGQDPVAGPVSRNQMTRAEFILRLIREVSEERIKWVIPDLHKVEPIETVTDIGGSSITDPSRSGGIPDDAGQRDPRKKQATGPRLTVKGDPMKPSQVRVANAIIKVGESLGARRKVIVVALMTGIQESDLKKDAKNGDHVGTFQQSSAYGSVTGREDPATAARMFYLGVDTPSGHLDGAIEVDKRESTTSYYQLAEDVQHSGLPSKYAPWRTEAERMVTTYGITGGDISQVDSSTSNLSQQAAKLTDGSYAFYRGTPPATGHRNWKPEDSWTCIQRLADEVQWRAFFVSGTFYYMDEFTLYRAKPRFTITEAMDAVTKLDCNYDSRKKAATIDLTVGLADWGAPPGSVIVIEEAGPLNGRWLVEQISRSLYNPYADISLSKPRPALPEPAGSNLPGSTNTGDFTGGLTSSPTPRSGTYVNPFKNARTLRPERIDQGVDYAGTGPILAVGNGRILNVYQAGWPGGVYIMLELTDGPNAGQIVYYAEGINPSVHVGQTVSAGQQIGTFVPGSSTGIEVGWSSPTPGVPSDPYNGRPDGTETSGGKSFALFLQSLGVPTVAVG